MKFVQLFAGCLLLLSCGEKEFLERRDLIDPDAPTMTTIHVDWTTLFGKLPSGMTVDLWDSTGVVHRDLTNNVTSYSKYLSDGPWRLLIHNLSAGELNTFRLEDEDNYDSIRITAVPLSDHTAESWEGDGTIIQTPEPFGIALDTLDINNEEEARQDTEVVRPITTPLTVNIHFEDIENLRSVKAVINGFSTGYLLTQNRPEESKGKFYLDTWNKTLDDSNKKNGTVSTTIATFGLPDRHLDIATRDSMANMLTLQITLRNDSVIQRQAAIGNRFTVSLDELGLSFAQYNLSVTIGSTTDPIPLPNVPDSNQKQSGFSADVDKWEDGGNTDVHF